MHRYGMYSVYDKKGERYDTPFFALSDHMAERMFRMDINKNGCMLNQFKDDFQLYRLGWFDLVTAVFIGEDKMILEGNQIEKLERIKENEISNEAQIQRGTQSRHTQEQVR